MKNLTLVLSIIFSSFVSANPVAGGYTSLTQINQAAINSGNIFSEALIEYNNAPTLASISFATKLVFLDNVASATFSDVSITLNRRVGGVNMLPTNISVSRYNLEGNATKPSILATNSSDVLIAMPLINVVGSTVLGIKTLYITEYNIPLGNVNFPRPYKIGDYYELTWSFSGSYTLNGSSTPVTFSSIMASAKTAVLATSSHVTVAYDNKVQTAINSDGSVSVTGTGLKLGDYLNNWWFEKVDQQDRSTFSPDFSVTEQEDGALRVILLVPILPHHSWKIVCVASEE